MSVPAAPLSLRPNLRPWLGALLPFTALGLLPWWACLALCAALALGRLGEDGRSVATLLALLAAVLVSAPLLLGSAPDRLNASGTLFAQAAVVGLLSLASLRALEQGQRRGLLLPALALLLLPSPGGLAALLLSALSLTGAEAGPPLRLESQHRSRLGPATLAAATLLAGVALGLGALLHAAPTRTTASVAPQAAQPAHASPQPPSAQATAPEARQVRPPTLQADAKTRPVDQGLLLLPLAPLTGLLIVLCAVLLLQHTRIRRRAGRRTWAEYAALAAMLGTLFMLGVLGAGAGPGGPLSGSAKAVAGPDSGRGVNGAAGMAGAPGHDWVSPLLNAGLVLATLFFAVVAVFLYRALRRGSSEGQGGPAALPAPGTDAPAAPPLHRVRLAWRRLEAALAASGLARLGSETPEEFAARLSALLPTAAADLHTLTRLYLPVRYGGEVSEEQATTAEAAEVSVRQALPPPARSSPAPAPPSPSPSLSAPSEAP